MKRTPVSALLLSVALVFTGCNTAAPPTQAGDSNRRASNQDEYNRTYENETHHRHRHGRRDEASNDNWGSYDRTDEAPGTANAGTQRSDQGGSRRTGDEGAGSRRGRRQNSHAVQASPGQFDFYLLNLSWSPEFCHGHPAAAECAQHRAFTLHGLWPQDTDGTYPEDCSEAAGPASPSQYADIYPDAALLQHEWQTHGTCSGLAPDAFFALARRAEQSIVIPAELSNAKQPETLAPSQLITLFTQSNPTLPASSIAISCGNNYLTAVEVCMDKNLKPESCSAVKTCGANQVRIPAPQ